LDVTRKSRVNIRTTFQKPSHPPVWFSPFETY